MNRGVYTLHSPDAFIEVHMARYRVVVCMTGLQYELPYIYMKLK